MAINSRDKGNKSERVVAKLLEEWTGKEFARTPSSGGLQWSASNAKGDIVCTTEGHLFPLCCEVKNHKKVDFNELLTGKKKPKIIEFWEQCIRDAHLAKKVPILFFRYNNLPKDFFFVVLDTSTYTGLRKDQLLNTIGIDTFKVSTHKYKLTIITSGGLFKFNYKTLKKTLKPVLKKWRKRKA